MYALHDSLVAAELATVGQDDRQRFSATVRALTDLAEIDRLDLDHIERDATIRGIEAKHVGDPLWRCWRALAESAQLMRLVDELEAGL